MLPMRFFRNRTFTAANVASLFMFVGMFGSIFLLAQYFQTVQGASPLQSGLRILPWTAMPILIAPIAGLLSDRIGGRPIMATGLALQATGLAWIGAILTTTLPYSSIVIPFALSGIGMAMYFAPVANVVLSSVKPEEEGQASGANNAIRELGGVFGVAVLAAVFSHYGGYQTPDSFVHGVTPALYLGAAIVAIGAAAALFIPRRRKTSAEAPQVERSGRADASGVARGRRRPRQRRSSCRPRLRPPPRRAPGRPRPSPCSSCRRRPGRTRWAPARSSSSTGLDASPARNGTKPRSFVMQLWYPRAAGKGRRERYMPPKVAAFVAADGGLPASIFTRVKLAAISDAAPRRRAGGWPVVLFSTGYGVERQLYTGLVQDLASHGYVVAAIDHPHDASIVSFPDGHTVSIGKVGESPNAISNALTVRIADTRYVLDTLTRLNRGSRTGAFSGMFDLDHVGMFGHSLGGATAAATMLIDRRIDAGLDMDGLLFGKVAVTGLEKPFMLFAADPGFRHKPNLAQFWGHLTRTPLRSRLRRRRPPRVHRPRVSRAPVGRHEQSGRASSPPAPGRHDQPDGRVRSRARLRPRVLRSGAEGKRTHALNELFPCCTGHRSLAVASRELNPLLTERREGQSDDRYPADSSGVGARRVRLRHPGVRRQGASRRTPGALPDPRRVPTRIVHAVCGRGQLSLRAPAPRRSGRDWSSEPRAAARGWRNVGDRRPARNRAHDRTSTRRARVAPCLAARP